MKNAATNEAIIRAIEAARQLPRSREAALVLTKLEEAQLWLTCVSTPDGASLPSEAATG